ncbi:phenylalanyl-tRNA synthetase alpha chain [Geosmithia morbida]|uniref:Phenylalanine--tRNA ligase, mitochondrial n=1 Tax=Geosmithia morbida TaxID=1094350 RepID=A0A9P4YV66_9HYPO|nr:phenylalanyl-tRNA synthetase alpha chain [Geosmithia morbida]KAF4123696.1 phenylalanyl-tRNA synthetase alpha chain [Geosmithia morbida]
MYAGGGGGGAAHDLRMSVVATVFRLGYGSATSSPPPSSVTIRGSTYKTDRWFNVPPNVLEATSRGLHMQKDHPISITRKILEASFPPPTYRCHHALSPVVTTEQNFDSLGFPRDHPGRARSDTYYVNATTLLRTHTSAHQADTFRADESDGYLIAADVYRRDAIDSSHYPVFHQMEAARSWDRRLVPDGDVAAAIMRDVELLPRHGVEVEDDTPAFHPERNPLQGEHHSPAEAQAITAHLKRSLENMVVDVFSRAERARAALDGAEVRRPAEGEGEGEGAEEPLRMRWVEASFPFTSPSWELEVYYAGDWLEMLGSGVVRQHLYIDAGVPHKLGWAFGIGIDRLAMLLFRIPDIRLFWSRDRRFLSQFEGVEDNLDGLRSFVPFSKYPPAPRDLSFWLPRSSRDGAAGDAFHENDVMEIVRSVGGDTVEEVKQFDAFTHPKTGRESRAYRIVYRSWDRTLTSSETNELHDRVCEALTRELGVTLR